MGTMTALRVLDCEDIAWFRADPEMPSAARGAAATLARRIGLEGYRASEVALAVTEAATNLQRHATDGALLLRVLRTPDRAGVEFVTVDTGPGMADVDAALADGTSTAGTLGIGLGAVARLADVFDIHSVPGRGTVIAAQFWAREAVAEMAGKPSVASGLTRPISGETTCGDAWAVRVDPGADHDPRSGPAPSTASAEPAILVMLCDGLGHGPMAALAGEAAVKAFRGSAARHPEGLLRDIHTALRGTRGGAVAVARIEPSAQRLLYCGIGNVSGVLLGPESRNSLLSAPGIVGQQMRSLRTFELPLKPGGALVMHSDGLTERWRADDVPGLLRHTPAVMAGQLLREAGVRRDDAGIVVVKGAW
ncbi:ATP-binding SpoIIE family protein phosphatase [Streptomyces microflavus]|uniref:ATP-binding SpoIIE family protein phosphatase n=1 Tax=Streptomyces microflavus TaxID=1919 RepID=UPI0029B68CE9|nr:ATP-binding SpoIIE family protein phosphatase [Streptomyces microflavus]MDX2407744.1 ATP-binding protein/SpoIIE family protein phosphatase [Streptomyces microflavus]